VPAAAPIRKSRLLCMEVSSSCRAGS
jgi:hypothetical protein